MQPNFHLNMAMHELSQQQKKAKAEAVGTAAAPPRERLADAIRELLRENTPKIEVLGAWAEAIYER